VNLAELQRYFAAAATSGTGPIAGLSDVFSEGAHLGAAERLAIYNRAFFYRQLDALAAVFTSTQRALGDAEFQRLGLAYLSAHPSDHPAVERVGRLFPEFLAEIGAAGPSAAGSGAPRSEPIADLAALEWARLCALVAPNPAALALPNAVAAEAFPSCRVTFVPSLSWLELDARALAIFAEVERGGDPEARRIIGAAPRSAVAVWRSGHAVRHECIEATEFRALAIARAGGTLAEVCAEFDTGKADADAQSAFRTLSAWYAKNWLEKLELAGP
jgi:hypothetical protein